MAKYPSRRKARSEKGKDLLAYLYVRAEHENPLVSYSRSKFGHGWADNDGDGQNERAEVLINAHRPGRGKVPIVYTAPDERVVDTGRWRCRFSGEWHTDASDLDIDHLVPLAEAWVSGAYAWKDELRERYANGVGIRSWRRAWLLPVKNSLNRSKGAKRPDEWLPPNEPYRLNYAYDWIATKAYWKLSVLQTEKDVLLKLLEE